jgi:hypothetical protein
MRYPQLYNVPPCLSGEVCGTCHNVLGQTADRAGTLNVTFLLLASLGRELTLAK